MSENYQYLVVLTDENQVKPGTLIIVDYKLGWDIKRNDLYWIKEIKDNNYLYLFWDSQDKEAKEDKNNCAQLLNKIFYKKEQGANPYIMQPTHPDYGTAITLLGLSSFHPEINIYQMVYTEVCKSYHAIDDFRSKLLSFLPFASGGIFIFLGDSFNQIKSYLAPIGAFGFLVTVGLFVYELHGIRSCGIFRTRGEKLEDLMGIKGQFKSLAENEAKKGFKLTQPIAAYIIYPAVLAAWLYVFIHGLWTITEGIFNKSKNLTDISINIATVGSVGLISCLLSHNMIKFPEIKTLEKGKKAKPNRRIHKH